MIFAYFGPETTLPIASGVAAVAGFVLMGGKLVMMKIKGVLGIKPKGEEPQPEPVLETPTESLSEPTQAS